MKVTSPLKVPVLLTHEFEGRVAACIALKLGKADKPTPFIVLVILVPNPLPIEVVAETGLTMLVPEAANPIEGVLFVQLYTVPFTAPVKLTAAVGEPLHTF